MSIFIRKHNDEMSAVFTNGITSISNSVGSAANGVDGLSGKVDRIEKNLDRVERKVDHINETTVRGVSEIHEALMIAERRTQLAEPQ